MNKSNHKIYLRDKHNLETRLQRNQFEDQPDAMFKDSNIPWIPLPTFGVYAVP